MVTPAFEMGTYYAEMGIPRAQITDTGAGDVDRSEGITVRVLNSIHGSRVNPPTETVSYGGTAASFMCCARALKRWSLGS